MNQYNDIINEMASLSFFAGEEIMKFYPNKIVSEKKDDFSPVTEADRASDKLICDRLEKKFPEILCISEESYKCKNLTKILIKLYHFQKKSNFRFSFVLIVFNALVSFCIISKIFC